MKIIKESKSKNAQLIISVLLGLFCIYNLFWYFGEYKVYNDLQKDFPEIESSSVKIYTDTDNIQYSVSVPDYLLWNGNLAIAEENVQMFTQYNEMNSQYHNTLYLYGNDKKIMESIKSTANIQEREYTSLISGVTECDSLHKNKVVQTGLGSYITSEIGVIGTVRDKMRIVLADKKYIFDSIFKKIKNIRRTGYFKIKKILETNN